jgi:hypothetical protein
VKFVFAVCILAKGCWGLFYTQKAWADMGVFYVALAKKKIILRTGGLSSGLGRALVEQHEAGVKVSVYAPQAPQAMQELFKKQGLWTYDPSHLPPARMLLAIDDDLYIGEGSFVPTDQPCSWHQSSQSFEELFSPLPTVLPPYPLRSS